MKSTINDGARHTLTASESRTGEVYEKAEKA